MTGFVSGLTAPLGPLVFGAPDRIRTCGPQIRNLVLYPTELRALLYFSISYRYSLG
jgi:hypothetical protein